MKIKTLLLFVISFICSNYVLSQSPKIEVQVSSINQEVTIDDSILVKIPIRNAGNRDLIYSIEKVAPMVYFSKNDYADYTLTENQDRITRDIWLTRPGNYQILINKAIENLPTSLSPLGTLWAFGNSNELLPENYMPWQFTVGSPQWITDLPMSMYLPQYNEKIDITFKRWTRNEGGFSYVRTGITPWIKLINPQGVVPPTFFDTIKLWLNSKMLLSGTYNANLIIKSNDPINNTVTIPINFKVTGMYPNIEIELDNYGFGDSYLMDTNKLYISVFNYGYGDLIINEIEGLNENFILLSSLPVIIPGKGKSDLKLGFIPTQATTYNTTIILKTNDPIKPIVNLSLSGTGIQGSPQIYSDSYTIDFGINYLDWTDSTTIEIKNTGTAFLNITEIKTTTNDFYLKNTSLSIAPGKTSKLTVYFKPLSTGYKEDTLKLFTNDPVNSEVWIGLIGESINVPGISLSSTNISEILNAKESITKEVIITNTGNDPVNLIIYPVIPNSKVFFQKKDWADYNLPENQDRITDDIWITRKSREGLFNYAIESIFDYTVSPAKTLWQQGNTLMCINDMDSYENWNAATGYCPPCMVDKVMSLYLPDYNRFFDVYMHSWTSQARGGGFSYTRIEVPSWLKVDENEIYLEPGEQATLNISIDAATLNDGFYNANIEIKDDYLGNTFGNVTVDLKVNGSPEISVSTNSIDFETVINNIPFTKQFTIKNIGSDTLSIYDIQTSGNEFSIDERNFNILPGKSKNINVTVKATQIGNISGVLTILSNDTVNSQININLTANSIDNYLEFTPTSFSYVLPSDSTFVDSLIIKNTGNMDVIIGGLKAMLDRLNNYQESVRDLIPFRYEFAYDGNNYEIVDGGNDMYDGGNRLYTDLSQIEYSDNVIRDGSYAFGENTEYFTRHLPGLFVMVAKINGINEFFIDGDLGADGSGNSDTTRLIYEKNGFVYTGFVKRVYNAWDPSVNHLIIIPKTTNVYHNYEANTDYDYHSVSNLLDAKYIAYLLFSSQDGRYINNEDIFEIMKYFVDYIFILPDTIKPNQTLTQKVTISTNNLKDGKYNYEIILNFDSPVQIDFSIPVNIKVQNIKQNIFLNDTVVNEGFETMTINLTNGYTDYKGNLISPSIIVANSNDNIVNLLINNSKMIITEKAPGTTLITVRAEDEKGNVIYSDFNFRINARPIIITQISDLIKNQGFGTTTVNLAEVFSDPENENLTYTVSSSNNNVVNISVNQSNLIISEVGNGIATITVRATDIHDAYAETEFKVKINANPIVVSPIADITKNQGFGTTTVTLTGVFSDPENENLSYTISSSNNNVATASINGSEIIITEVGIGSSVITVRASDPHGAFVEDQFNITINQINNVELSNTKDLKIYPNPAREFINLEFNYVKEGILEIEIMNLNGAIITKNSYNIQSGIAQIRIDNLFKGTYILRYKVDNLTGYQRIIVE